MISSLPLKNKSLFMRTSAACAALLMLCTAAAGCRNADPGSRPLSGELRVRLRKNPATLDPARIVDLDGARIAAKLYNGLVGFDEHFRPIPDLAGSWRVSEDGRTYTFFLKRGILFHNGRELTADDVLYSFERVLRPQTCSPRTWVLSRIAGAEEFLKGRATSIAGLQKQGDYEVVIRLSEPFAPFLHLLGLTTASIIPRPPEKSHDEESAFQACGTGPFMLTQWRHGQYLLLEQNRSYHFGTPGITRLRYEIIPEDFTALTAFEKADVDVLPEITAADYDRLSQDPGRRACMIRQQPLNVYYLGLNCQREPFTDARVRQALHHALDKEKIFTTLLGARGMPARGPLPPLLRGDDGAEQYPYSPERSRALLREAGYPEGFAMTIYQPADAETLDILQAVQGYLSRVGVKARIEQLEWSTFLQKVAQGDAAAFWLSWWADYPDAENFLFPLFHSQNWGAGGNRCRFYDPDVDRRIAAATSIRDDAGRKAAYREIEEQIIQRSPFIWCWHKSVVGIFQPWVKGLQLPPLPVMEKWHDVRLEGR